MRRGAVPRGRPGDPASALAAASEELPRHDDAIGCQTKIVDAIVDGGCDVRARELHAGRSDRGRDQYSIVADHVGTPLVVLDAGGCRARSSSWTPTSARAWPGAGGCARGGLRRSTPIRDGRLGVGAMKREELETWLAVKGGDLCVDRSPVEGHPGFLRHVTIRRPARVIVEFLWHSVDEGGPTFALDAGQLDRAIELLEAYLGQPVQVWENFSATDRIPAIPEIGITRAESELRFADCVRKHSLRLPVGFVFSPQESYWRRVAETNGSPSQGTVERERGRERTARNSTMKITITAADKLGDGTTKVRFKCDVGEAYGRWGAKTPPHTGDTFTVEIDTEAMLDHSCAQEGQESRYGFSYSESTSKIEGLLESVDPDGVGYIRVAQDALLMIEITPDFWDRAGRWVILTLPHEHLILTPMGRAS